MKKLLLTAFIFATMLIISMNAFGNSNEGKSALVGSWKYTTQSSVNDFQKISNTVLKEEYSTEFFIFSPNNSFKHEFLNKEGAVVKTLKGKWKLLNNKIKIEYADFNYSLNLDYFFLDNDLVLGQNFNHVIFTKGDMIDGNIASIK